eukprot:COSAG06_NODE_1947_length_8003_cov_17.512146_2_plen_121_part_00
MATLLGATTQRHTHTRVRARAQTKRKDADSVLCSRCHLSLSVRVHVYMCGCVNGCDRLPDGRCSLLENDVTSADASMEIVHSTLQQMQAQHDKLADEVGSLRSMMAQSFAQLSKDIQQRK